CSTSTLEHIPADDIRAILGECVRISSSQALCSFIIDYHDHYASADRSITYFNFYKYTTEEWKRFNPPNHFQNRLRHSDHERLFGELGLRVIENRRIVAPWADRDFARCSRCAD